MPADLSRYLETDADSRAADWCTVIISAFIGSVGTTSHRRAGVQIGTIDALLGQLCIRHELTLLTTDADFTLAARHCPLRVWSPAL